MKNKLKLFGVIAVVAIFGYSLVGCGIDTGAEARPGICIFEPATFQLVDNRYAAGSQYDHTGAPNPFAGVKLKVGDTVTINYNLEVIPKDDETTPVGNNRFSVQDTLDGYKNVVVETALTADKADHTVVATVGIGASSASAAAQRFLLKSDDGASGNGDGSPTVKFKFTKLEIYVNK